jgi:transposase-like protein
MRCWMPRRIVSAEQPGTSAVKRGLRGVQLFISDKCLGLVENLAEFYPEAKWQRPAVRFYRNVWTAVPTDKVKEVAAMLKAIHAQEDALSGQGGRRTRVGGAFPDGKSAPMLAI